MQPLLAAGLAAIVLHEPLRRATTDAGVLGVVGVSLLVLRASTHLDPVGIAAALAATTPMLPVWC